MMFGRDATGSWRELLTDSSGRPRVIVDSGGGGLDPNPAGVMAPKTGIAVTSGAGSAAVSTNSATSWLEFCCAVDTFVRVSSDTNACTGAAGSYPGKFIPARTVTPVYVSGANYVSAIAANSGDSDTLYWEEFRSGADVATSMANTAFNFSAATAAQVVLTNSLTRWIEVYSTEDCWVTYASPAGTPASGVGKFIPALQTVAIHVDGANYLNVYSASAGTIYVSEFRS